MAGGRPAADGVAKSGVVTFRIRPDEGEAMARRMAELGCSTTSCYVRLLLACDADAAEGEPPARVAVSAGLFLEAAAEARRAAAVLGGPLRALSTLAMELRSEGLEDARVPEVESRLRAVAIALADANAVLASLVEGLGSVAEGAGLAVPECYARDLRALEAASRRGAGRL